MNVLVIGPHPDDEVLGVGGTMSRLVAEGAEVHAAIVTKGFPPMFPEEFIEQGRKEATQAHQFLGVKSTIFLDEFPAAMLDTVPHAKLNEALSTLIGTVRPRVLFIPFVGDLHFDHRLVFESCLVACRPQGQFIPDRVYAYETVSETNWNASLLSPAFAPNVFVDISEYLDTKLKAVEIYRSQMQSFPHERSLEAVRALAVHRGSTVGLRAAESFILIRSLHAGAGSAGL